MDITSMDEKSFDITKIKKTIVIQIDHNGNGCETSIINPEVNLILTAILEYCKKNEITEDIMIDIPEIGLHQNNKYEKISEKMNKVLDVKRNGFTNSKENIKSVVQKDKSSDQSKVNTSIINTNSNINKEKSSQHKHRFLSQDTNAVQNYNYKTPNEQYYVERKSYKNKVEAKEIKQMQKEELNVPDILEETINNNNYNNIKLANNTLNNIEKEPKKIEGILSNKNAPLRKIKKSNFIQRFYDLNK